MSSIVDLHRTNGIVPHAHHKTSLGIRGQLLIGFTAIVLIFLLAIGATLYVINTAKSYSKQVISVDLPIYDSLLDLNSEIYQSESAMQSSLLLNDNKYKSQLSVLWENIAKTESTIDDLTRNWTNSTYVKAWGEIKTSLLELKNAQLNNIAITDKASAIKNYESTVLPIMYKVTTQLNTINLVNTQSTGLLDLQSKQLQTGTKEILDSLDYIQLTEYILSVIGIIASILIATFTAKAIIRHINIFRDQSSRIASGDLTQSINIESYDEMGQLGVDLNTMTSSLAAMTKDITQCCHNMVATLEEVRHAVDAQSSGASEQASSINEITASLSEIEKSSSQTMEKAKSLGEAAERTREKGQLGLEAVDQSVNGMKEVRDKVQMIAQTILDLSNKTQQVGEITAVVNNLAQQSKMLALNASIEAAKAGEAGKGFAVVAIEVKNLAEQSEQATSQVQKILEDIRHAAEKAVMVTEEGTKGVDHGTALVEQTGDVIRNLNDVIHETTIATQQIESAVRQESAGIEQITAGMNEINQVTASFVESVKQTTEAMTNLANISKNLKMYVDTYKISK